MPAHLTIVPKAGGEQPRPSGVVCPVCSDHFGFRFRPLVTIKPAPALRLASGSIVIDDPTVICAICAERGIETVL